MRKNNMNILNKNNTKISMQNYSFFLLLFISLAQMIRMFFFCWELVTSCSEKAFSNKKKKSRELLLAPLTDSLNNNNTSNHQVLNEQQET